MNNKNIITTAGIFMVSAILVFACQNLTPLGYCSGSAQQPAKCANGCVAINYTPYVQIACVYVPEGGCGASDCTTSCVNCWKHTFNETPKLINGACVGCGLPSWQDDEPAGTCNQDYIPEGVTSCGNCN